MGNGMGVATSKVHLAAVPLDYGRPVGGGKGLRRRNRDGLRSLDGRRKSSHADSLLGVAVELGAGEEATDELDVGCDDHLVRGEG